MAKEWLRIKACDDRQAEYIGMKLKTQKCRKCNGGCETCDLYTSDEEEMEFAKYLIEKYKVM